MNYELTPHGQDKYELNPSSMDNYNIDDLTSGDETDDDQAPRKKVPAWAQKPALNSALSRQYKNKNIGGYSFLQDLFSSKYLILIKYIINWPFGILKIKILCKFCINTQSQILQVKSIKNY